VEGQQGSQSGCQRRKVSGREAALRFFYKVNRKRLFWKGNCFSVNETAFP
jgi:hypothetical protein